MIRFTDQDTEALEVPALTDVLSPELDTQPAENTSILLKTGVCKHF